MHHACAGKVEEFQAPAKEDYKLQVWGAAGKNIGPHYGGRGAYCKGNINLTASATLYVVVGNQDGYNGGGLPSTYEYVYGNNGGSATDIRLVNTVNWRDFDGLKSRIMVAAGGGGANYRNIDLSYDYNGYKSESLPNCYGEGDGGYGGGLTGGIGQSINNKGNGEHYYGYCLLYGGTQTSGGDVIIIKKEGFSDFDVDALKKQLKGHFGYAEHYLGSSNRDSLLNQSAGGGGYYGGGSGTHCGGAGGSSFISGYPGCNAISESSTENNIVHTDQPNHYSGYVFSNAVMKAGNEVMPSPKGGTETGHTGNGYAIIRQQ